MRSALRHCKAALPRRAVTRKQAKLGAATSSFRRVGEEGTGQQLIGAESVPLELCSGPLSLPQQYRDFEAACRAVSLGGWRAVQHPAACTHRSQTYFPQAAGAMTCAVGEKMALLDGLSDRDSVQAGFIIIRDSSTRQVVCRLASQSATPPQPANKSRGSKDAPGKLVEEVLEVVRAMTGCTSAVLMDGPDEHRALAYTRSDRISPGTYYSHQPAAKATKAARSTSWQSQLASVIVAFITLGLVMQSLIIMVAVPSCGCNWKCLHNWYRVFIGHIDGPFKVFTFMAAIQRAWAHPDIWLTGFSRVSRAIAGMLKPEDAKSSKDMQRPKED